MTHFQCAEVEGGIVEIFHRSGRGKEKNDNFHLQSGGKGRERVVVLYSESFSLLFFSD